MLYLLDANVLIDAARDYYPFERVPEFWDWLAHHGTSGNVKMPLEIYEEITGGRDEVSRWLRTDAIKSALLMAEEADPEIVSRVVSNGYAPDLTDDEIVKAGRDPFLIAYALVTVGARCVVTTEVSRPRRVRANRHVPDVCMGFGITWCNTFELTRRLDFRTRWR